MDEMISLATLLRERTELMARSAPRAELDELTARCHGKPVRAIGIVRGVEANMGKQGPRSFDIAATDEVSGEPVRYLVGAAFLSTLPVGPSRGQFQQWQKGKRVTVEGRLVWPEVQSVPCVEVTAVRYT